MKTFFTILAILIVVGVLGFFGYTAYTTGNTSSFSVAEISSRLGTIGSLEEVNSNVDSREIVSLFRSVASINLDGSLLVSPEFRQLEDITVPIVIDQITGRANPFLPIGQTPPEPEPTVEDNQESDSNN